MTEYLHSNADFACSSDYILPIIEAELARLPRESVIADLGCGNGSMLGHLRHFGFELHGLEMSHSGLQQAQRAYPEIEFSWADLTADLSSHPLANSCDAVISTEVVEHIFLPRLFAANCYRMLKPGGRLIISTPYHGYFKNLVLGITGKLDSHFTALWDYGHIKFWSRRTLSRLLGEAGFSIQDFRGAGRAPLFWKSMIVIARKLPVQMSSGDSIPEADKGDL